MYPDHESKFPELGFYGLPGHTRSPRDILKQAQDAEAEFRGHRGCCLTLQFCLKYYMLKDLYH
mgnify:CR=1 FL=1